MFANVATPCLFLYKNLPLLKRVKSLFGSKQVRGITFLKKSYPPIGNINFYMSTRREYCLLIISRYHHQGMICRL